MFKNRYRIVTDRYAGYEAQIKYWYLPLVWLQMNQTMGTNTFYTIESAERFIRDYVEIQNISKHVVAKEVVI